MEFPFSYAWFIPLCEVLGWSAWGILFIGASVMGGVCGVVVFSVMVLERL